MMSFKMVMKACNIVLKAQLMNLEKWLLYGETLAASHPDIMHDNSYGKKSFAVVDVEEAFGDLKSLTGEVVLRWIIPTWTKVDVGGNPRDLFNAGFLVLVRHKRGDSPSYIKAIVKAQKIADEIVSRINYESKLYVDMFAGSSDVFDDMQINGTPLKAEGDAAYSGWLVTLAVWDFANDCVVVDGQSKWLDLNRS
jgi:hypothetical protein